jgi:hypothetical protein
MCYFTVIEMQEQDVIDNSWYSDDGRFIGSCKDVSVRRALTQLRHVVSMNPEQQLQELFKCDSSGIMCLVAAACPSLYLDTHDITRDVTHIIPSDKLEFDMRGVVDIAVEGRFCYIHVGEVKSKLEYGKAVEQLGLRLRALKWLVSAAVFSEEDGVDFRLVGRLFVKQNKQDVQEYTDAEQRQFATSMWGYSLYVHYFN